MHPALLLMHPGSKSRPRTLPSLPSAPPRWEALEHALRAVAEAGGNMTAYREDIWKQGRWLWWAGPGGRVQEAGKGRFTQMSCANATFGGGEGGGG